MKYRALLGNKFPRLSSRVKLHFRFPWLYSLGPGLLEEAMAVLKHILFDYGYAESYRRRKCVNGNGEEVPWYAYPAIEYLSSLDFTDKTVFEYGAGASTLWWAKRAERVVSVEHAPEWHDSIKDQMPSNCELMFRSAGIGYCESILERQETFDVIVVDGTGDNFSRLRCALAGVERLKSGGMIIVDNSDWLPKTCDAMRSLGLIEIDFSGPLPLNTVFGRTSLFFDTTFNFRQRHVPTHGGVSQSWEAGDLPDDLAEKLQGQRQVSERR